MKELTNGQNDLKRDVENLKVQPQPFIEDVLDERKQIRAMRLIDRKELWGIVGILLGLAGTLAGILL